MSRIRCSQGTPFEPKFFEFFQPRTGLANFLRARAQRADNFPRNYFAFGKPECNSTVLPVILVTP